MDLIPTWVNNALQPVEKMHVHRHGLRHKAVSVFALDGDRILLQQRAATKYHSPNLWANTCCTHPHWEESDEACAQRRLAEELGIQGLELQPVGVVSYRAYVGGGLIEDEVVQVFTARASQALPLDLNPDEVQATRWISVADLVAEIEAGPNRFSTWLQIYLSRHRQQILGPQIMRDHIAK